MSSDDLTAFSFVVMALVGSAGAGPHDLVHMARRGHIYWAASESQYYAEPKRLAALGYLDARKEPGKTRERTHYTLTDAARAALERWASEPTSFPRMQQQGPVRVMIADLVGEASVRASVTGMRGELAALAEEVADGERAAAQLPHREKYLLLNHRLSRRLIRAHEEWIDEVERELEA